MYIFVHQDQGVQKGGKCSAMYFNLYSTFPSAICYPFHFTWFLLLLSVPRCHSSGHFAMDLATFQHILIQRGLPSIHRTDNPTVAIEHFSTYISVSKIVSWIVSFVISLKFIPWGCLQCSWLVISRKTD